MFSSISAPVLKESRNEKSSQAGRAFKSSKALNAYKTAECRSGLVKLKRVSGDQKAWSWWELNVLFALTWGRGEKDPGLHAGRAVLVSRARSETQIQTVSHVWTAYEWTKHSQDDSVYTVCCGRAALSHLFQYCGGVQGWTGPQVECYSGVLAMELGVEVSTGFIGGMALWLKYSTTCLGTSARTHFARAAGEACKSHTFIGLHERGHTLTTVKKSNRVHGKLCSNKGMRTVQFVV